MQYMCARTRDVARSVTEVKAFFLPMIRILCLRMRLLKKLTVTTLSPETLAWVLKNLTPVLIVSMHTEME